MAKSKFTPGPWESHGPTEEGNAAKRVFAGTTYLGTVTNSDMDHEEIAANADLMADAPALLEILRTLHDFALPLRERGLAVESERAFADARALLDKHGG
jgi:hypothetical protein